MSVTLKEDLADITAILNETFRTVPFKKDYNTAFGACNIPPELDGFSGSGNF